MNSSPRIFSRFLALLADGASVFISVWLAYFLRFNFSIPAAEMSEIPIVMGIIIPVRLLMFAAMNYFTGLLRDTELSETFRSILLLIMGSFIFILVDFVTYYFVNERLLLPLTIIILEFFLSTVLILFSRSMFTGGRGHYRHGPALWENAKAPAVRTSAGHPPVAERKLSPQLQTALRNLIQGKRILITAAGGSTASGLVRELTQGGPSLLILADTSEETLKKVFTENRGPDAGKLICQLADTSNESRMEKLFRRHKPQIVFHTAAYSDEKLLEEFPGEAIRLNVNGTRIITELSASSEAETMITVLPGSIAPEQSVLKHSGKLSELLLGLVNSENSCRMIALRYCSLLSASDFTHSILAAFIDGKKGEVYETRLSDSDLKLLQARKIIMDSGLRIAGDDNPLNPKNPGKVTVDHSYDTGIMPLNTGSLPVTDNKTIETIRTLCSEFERIPDEEIRQTMGELSRTVS